MPTARLFHILAAILFGIALVLELLSLSQFRYSFLFAGLLAVALGHSV